MNYGMRFVTLYRRQGSRPSPWKGNAKKAKWLSGEALQIAVNRREVKGEKERDTHLNAKFQIKHNMGIPYNPQGQAIVKRTHQTLKIQIKKLKKGEFKYSSPHQILQHALFIINN